jgi:hypothetical protein
MYGRRGNLWGWPSIIACINGLPRARRFLAESLPERFGSDARSGALHGPDREPGLAGGGLDFLGRDGAGAQDLPQPPFGLAALRASHTTWVLGSLGGRGGCRASSASRLAAARSFQADVGLAELAFSALTPTGDGHGYSDR